MQLIIANNSVANPLTLDLSNYIVVQEGEGMDPSDPAFREAVISHSLLKEGGVLALENLQAKELAFPLRLKSTTSGGITQLIQEINQIVTMPGATASWQDDGLSQPTVFKLISGQFDIAYNYREAQNHMLSGKLRLFSQPLGQTAAPRTYAAASGVGPLLMISPYASSGALAIGASTQAGVAGFGGAPMGASSGVFFPGAPSLAGDAPGRLQISYVGPLPNNATSAGVVPTVAMSLLPDKYYQPLITITQTYGGSTNLMTGADAVASQYLRSNFSLSPNFQLPLSASPIPISWAGFHRVFAIARASTLAQSLSLVAGANVPQTTTATVYPGDWQLLDLGVVSLRANETAAAIPNEQPQVVWSSVNNFPASNSVVADVTAFVMLPDNATWYVNPSSIIPSQYGGPVGIYTGQVLVSQGVYTNTILVDDAVGDQFLYTGASQQSAPSPIAAVRSAELITPYSRGLVPRPDPKNGLPILAILGVGQNGVPSTAFSASAAWPNPQNQRTMAQVNVLERTRYVLP